MTTLENEVAVSASWTRLKSRISEEKEQTDLYCSLTECDQEELKKIIAYLERIGHL